MKIIRRTKNCMKYIHVASTKLQTVEYLEIKSRCQTVKFQSELKKVGNWEGACAPMPHSWRRHCTPTCILRPLGLCPVLPGWRHVSQYQKCKTNLDFTEARDSVSGSGISWATCKSAPRTRQITMQAPHHSVLTGQMPFLPPNQQHQSTEGCNVQKCSE